ncbi:acetyl xylan esterase 1 [Bacteroides reticulotermitis JCM 10512]|uniref:Acetyl xylan esterase 1 n=1 Tax=Bacteroides reticulotermitis JCM 10512 TaxID=1445607 RepID=W4UX04_9BACE|nr:acetyl xylan esterase 1 [Bacteroides reticulotermitis JCM 10512]
MNRTLKKLLLSVWILSITSLWAVAENYPYRSDVLWATVPNHADWLYKTGEQATVEVQMYKYGIPVDKALVTYEIGGDMMPADAQGNVTLKNGKAVIPIGTMKQPGFRDCRVKATVDGKTYAHHVKVGFSPEKLQPYTSLPADFNQFWEKAKTEQAAFPLSYTKEHVAKYSTDKIDCYLIKLQLNRRGQSIYGYLFYPKGGGKYPVVLCPPGAGIKTIKEPLRHKYYAEQGFIRFEIEIHGLNPEMSDEEFKEISTAFNGGENGYLTNGLDSRDNYYMKRVYLACVRSIDLLTSLPEWMAKM